MHHQYPVKVFTSKERVLKIINRAYYILYKKKINILKVTSLFLDDMYV